jgi:organic hydroperoxide reductase OsmC/OhrA
LLVAALAQCHMLWFLHLCAVNGIVVISYTHDAQGMMAEGGDGGGQFTTVTLRPRAAITDSGQAACRLGDHLGCRARCLSATVPARCVTPAG